MTFALSPKLALEIKEIRHERRHELRQLQAKARSEQKQADAIKWQEVEKWWDGWEEQQEARRSLLAIPSHEQVSREQRVKQRIKAHAKRAHQKFGIPEDGRDLTYKEWVEVVERYDHRCVCCHRQEPDISLEADHVVPLAKGGSNHVENIQPLCFLCNRKKMLRVVDYRLTWLA